jgi:uncharacterized BrkB/YihY/UPF0761 family membrane protein
MKPLPPDIDNSSPGSLPDSIPQRWQAAAGIVFLKRAAKKIVRDRVSLSAGSLAYHWFLALFPGVIVVLGLLSLLHVGTRDVNSLTHAIDKRVATVLLVATGVSRTTARFQAR